MRGEESGGREDGKRGERGDVMGESGAIKVKPLCGII